MPVFFVLQADERRLNKKYTKSLIVRKMQQLKQTDDEELERKFQQALHTLGLKGTVQDTDTDEVIAIVQRQHEVAVELEQKKQSLSAHIASLREQIVDAKQQIEVGACAAQLSSPCQFLVPLPPPPETAC